MNKTICIFFSNFKIFYAIRIYLNDYFLWYCVRRTVGGSLSASAESTDQRVA